MTHSSSDDDKNAALLDRRTFFIGTASALALGTTACGGGSGGGFSPPGGATAQQPPQQTPAANLDAVAGVDTPNTTDTPAPEPTTPGPEVRKIVHPGLLVTETDLQRIRDKLAANAQLWVGGWNMMLRTNNTNLNATPRPLEVVVRGVDGEN